MSCRENASCRQHASHTLHRLRRRDAGELTPHQLDLLDQLCAELPYTPPVVDHAAQKADLIEALKREVTAEVAIASWRRQLATSHISQSQ
jgi:hypothetical protein